MSLALILSIGSPDSSLLDSRNLILRSAGYTVVPAFTVVSAIRQFQDGDFDLILVDSTVVIDDRDRLTDLIHGSGSRIPIVCVGSGFEQAKEGETDSLNAMMRADPDSLLDRIREALLK